MIVIFIELISRFLMLGGIFLPSSVQMQVDAIICSCTKCMFVNCYSLCVGSGALHSLIDIPSQHLIKLLSLSVAQNDLFRGLDLVSHHKTEKEKVAF